MGVPLTPLSLEGEAAVAAGIPNCIYATNPSFGRLGLQ